MNATLIRSAYTPIIYEMKDCSVALLDAEHQVLGQSAGLPIFLGNLEICTRLTEEIYGREAWRPGDVWIMNDSYLTGTHLNDMTVFGPIFHGGRAGRVRRLPGALARRRRQGPGRADGLDRDLPGGHPRPAAAGRRGRGRARATSSTCSAATAASRTRRSATCARRSRASTPGRRGCGDRRALRARRPCSPRASRSSPRPSARARGDRRDPRRRLRRRGLPRRRRRHGRAVLGPRPGRGRAATR